MSYVAEDFNEISAKRKALRREQGLPDDDWRTATGTDLDAIGGGCDVYRLDHETDYAFRRRIGEARKGKGEAQ
jgi:hypothetical protein